METKTIKNMQEYYAMIRTKPPKKGVNKYAEIGKQLGLVVTKGPKELK